MNKELEFKVKKILISETNNFLNEIDCMMKESGMENVSNVKTAAGRTQFKTIMDAAGKASSVEELLLFIFYQGSKSGGWNTGCTNNKSLAQNVADSLQHTLEVMSVKVSESIEDQNIDSEDRREIRLRIAEKYLGYLYWKATILKESR